MGILDEAIREHLELKRQHGAGDSELRELEDEAFGPPARPGAASDAAVADAPAMTDEDSAAKTELLSGLQEAPSAPPEAPEPPAEEPPAEEPPADEEEPAIEHPVAPGPDAGTVAIETEEHPPPEPAEEPEAASEVAGEVEPEGTSVADQPTELYDFGEEAPAPAEEAPAEEAAEPVEDEFFSEQSLSDELDQALDAPETEGAPATEPEPAEEPPAPSPEPPEEGEEMAPHEPDDHFDEESEEKDSKGEDSEGEDVLEETPEFLQDTPEHDRLWFEQRPPKDFDFDD